MLDIVILAAGQGTRMHSSLPKVLHPIGGKPMLAHVLDAARQLPDARALVVVGHGADQVRERFAGEAIEFVQQQEQLGTGHAVQQALPLLREGARVLILYGDVPLIRAETLKRLVATVSEQQMALLTVTLPDPGGYGRIVRNSRGEVDAIVEDRDASAEQRLINEINTGVMAVTRAQLQRWLPRLERGNSQGEYYLTDTVAMARGEGVAVTAVQPDGVEEVLGVNNRLQQAEQERHFQYMQARRLMAAGVTLLDPRRFDCRGEIIAGRDVVIDINCVFEGRVVLGDGVQVGPNCLLKDCSIGAHSRIKANSIIEEAELAENCDIGPFARLRPGTELAEGARIGNFVEIKKAVIGAGSKVNHLSYIGDSELGKDVNIGAGTITCNYDGVNKHHTSIGDNCFVGSNTALVAPVTLGAGSTVGAGSVITRDVPDDELAVARGKQRHFPDWQRPVKNQPGK